MTLTLIIDGGLHNVGRSLPLAIHCLLMRKDSKFSQMAGWISYNRFEHLINIFLVVCLLFYLSGNRTSTFRNIIAMDALLMVAIF